MKYISVADKLYKIRKISFYYMTVEAVETNLKMDDVPDNEVWDISEFEHYKVKLVNNGVQAEIIDFNGWKEKHDLKK